MCGQTLGLGLINRNRTVVLLLVYNGGRAKDSKSFVVTPSYPSKTSWEFCKKSDSDELIKLWKMTFQASEGKGKNFLELLDDDLNVVEPSYTKGGPWLQLVGHSNSLCAQATRAITNHMPIREYRLRFFPNSEFSCLCNEYPIESRRHILYDCIFFTIAKDSTGIGTLEETC